MPNSAQETAQAINDVERITLDFSATMERVLAARPHASPYGLWMATMVDLLQRDVIRVGKRPAAPEGPIPGQTTIEQQLGASYTVLYEEPPR